jgi:dTDP-glucose 4,6-dehydratase
MNMVQNLSTELSEPHLDRLIEAINQLGGSRVLLTGGTGFVGKWLIETAKIACENGATSFEIVVPTRSLNSKHALETKSIGFKNLSFVEGDILSQTLDFGSIDSIVHAATPASAKLTSENPSEMFRINKVSTESVLKYAHDKMPLLFTSSGAVYGVQPQSVSHIAESIMEPNPPTDELNSYAKGKQVAEKLCLDAGEQKICDSKIARLFAFSGRYLPRDTHFAIGNFIQNVLDRKPIFINSDGQSRRSYLYGADMATWLWCAVVEREVVRPLHVGSERSISILELAQIVAKVSEKILNFAPEINVAKPVSNKNIFHQYVPATATTRSLLKTDEWTTLEKSIELMIRHELI